MLCVLKSNNTVHPCTLFVQSLIINSVDASNALMPCCVQYSSRTFAHKRIAYVIAWSHKYVYGSLGKHQLAKRVRKSHWGCKSNVSEVPRHICSKGQRHKSDWWYRNEEQALVKCVHIKRKRWLIDLRRYKIYYFVRYDFAKWKKKINNCTQTNAMG